MAFATTDSYATGPQIGLRIMNDGFAYFPRSYTQAANSFRAPIFYDSNNTGYYLDPNSTSQFSYVLANDWFRAQSTSGFYTQDYGTHFRANQSSSHGAWEVFGWNKSGYCGVNINYNYYNNYMFDSDGNGGLYQQNGGGWIYYYYRGYDCVGISGSSTASGYAMRVNGNQYTDGYIYASAYYYTSDVNKKKNINTLENALDKVCRLRGVSFNWKEDDRYDSGMIAQEVEEVIPEAIKKDHADNDALILSPTPVMGYMIEAIKELRAEIDILKARLGE
jgi:hypothetical protein